MAKIPPLIQGAKCIFRVLFFLWKCTLFTNLQALWKLKSHVLKIIALLEEAGPVTVLSGVRA